MEGWETWISLKKEFQREDGAKRFPNVESIKLDGGEKMEKEQRRLTWMCITDMVILEEIEDIWQIWCHIQNWGEFESFRQVICLKSLSWNLKVEPDTSTPQFSHTWMFCQLMELRVYFQNRTEKKKGEFSTPHHVMYQRDEWENEKKRVMLID